MIYFQWHIYGASLIVIIWQNFFLFRTENMKLHLESSAFILAVNCFQNLVILRKPPWYWPWSGLNNGKTILNKSCFKKLLYIASDKVFRD